MGVVLVRHITEPELDPSYGLEVPFMCGDGGEDIDAEQGRGDFPYLYLAVTKTPVQDKKPYFEYKTHVY